MRNLIQSIVCNLLWLGIVFYPTIDLNAAHIVGGDVTYKFVRFNMDSTLVTFEIDFTLYRDGLSDGAGFDSAAETAFGVFRKNAAGDWNFIEEILEIGPGPISDVEVVDEPCVDEPIGLVAVEESSYIFEVTLEVGDTDYMVAYQRCCRNETIVNIFNPGDTGAAFDVIITPEAQRTGNNSPVFNTFPPIFICAGYPISVDQSSTDLEGDELRYTFCAPFTAGGTFDATGLNAGNVGCCDCVRPRPTRCGPDFVNVQFRPPYSPTAPLAGNPIVTIDSATGIITGVPELTGQFVVGVCVEEFRNGMSLGKIRRDFQFNVLECDRAVTALLESDSTVPDPNSSPGVNNGNSNIFIINACGETTIPINNLSGDINFIQTYDWEFYDEVGNVIFDATTRDVDVPFPGIGEYSGRMIVNEGIACSDTAPFFVNLYPAIFAGQSSMYDTCVAGPIDFEDLSTTGAGDPSVVITDWAWDFAGEGASSVQNPNFQFLTPGRKNVSLTVTDTNECVDEVVVPVDYFPAPATIIVEPNAFVGCNPSDITFTNLSAPIDSTYDITWDFGDGETGTEISPTHTYLEPGSYSLSLNIISPIGCEAVRSFDSWITIKESPIADFDCSPDNPNIYEKTVNFIDKSTNTGSWQWNFGTAGNSFVQNPTFTFPDTGLYKVLLTTFHPTSNCPDTISKLVDVIPLVDFFFPNAFTPNNDSTNDVFLGNGFYEGLNEYNLQIFNRWGQRIFESDNPREGWNGMEDNVGKPSPQGVYAYKATYRGPRGERVVTDGHVTLIR